MSYSLSCAVPFSYRFLFIALAEEYLALLTVGEIKHPEQLSSEDRVKRTYERDCAEKVEDASAFPTKKTFRRTKTNGHDLEVHGRKGWCGCIEYCNGRVGVWRHCHISQLVMIYCQPCPSGFSPDFLWEIGEICMGWDRIQERRKQYSVTFQDCS